MRIVIIIGGGLIVGFVTLLAAAAFVGGSSNKETKQIQSQKTQQEIKSLCSQSLSDGSVPAVLEHLAGNLDDPRLQDVEWSDVNVHAMNDLKLPVSYSVRFKYRARNGFGAYVLKNEVFFLSPDCKVVGVNDFEDVAPHLHQSIESD